MIEERPTNKTKVFSERGGSEERVLEEPGRSNKMTTNGGEIAAPQRLRSPPPPPPPLQASNNQTLINEAIKRILLDIVIRGHGERLIGRWSREPIIQSFLERVPYLLDRINQLHLICMRGGALSSELQHVHSHHHSHHHHSHHHHHHHHHHAAHHAHKRHNSSPFDKDDEQDDEERSCLHDFVNLIGSEHHWLVRTRDSLGLTPLHKAVLFNNRPIVEFILDRYPDELAPVGPGTQQQQERVGYRASGRSQSGGGGGQQRLIDAQDKYGRSALHYAAAAQVIARHHQDHEQQPKQGEGNQRVEQLEQASCFKFLLAKGADRQLRDFRGKTADFYLRHADQLRIRSIIHLANKLNANYQAVVLSRTLKALTFTSGQQLAGQLVNFNNPADQHKHQSGQEDDNGEHSTSRHDFISETKTRPVERRSSNENHVFDLLTSEPSENRASMSVSCADLRENHRQLASTESRNNNNNIEDSLTPTPSRSRSTVDLNEATLPKRFELSTSHEDQLDRLFTAAAAAPGTSDGSLMSSPPTPPRTITTTTTTAAVYNQDHDWPLPSSSLCSSAPSHETPDDLQWRRNGQTLIAGGGGHHNSTTSLATAGDLKRLLAERVERPILDEKTRARVKKCLAEARLEAINQLVADGLGQLVLEQARLFCWNLACKRYIANIIPRLLTQLDALHEFVATNQFLALRALVSSEPLLARCRRPYKRARLNALHLAVQLNRKSIVAHLVSRFPELVRELDSHGASCLHWAARSLHSDRLYNWLRDHFGAQLEALHDSRGKTAADYRQQAIRLASFDQQQDVNQAARQRRKSSTSSTLDVNRILRDTQRQENGLLASGAKSQLIKRPNASKGSSSSSSSLHQVHDTAKKRVTQPKVVDGQSQRGGGGKEASLELASSMEEPEGENDEGDRHLEEELGGDTAPSGRRNSSRLRRISNVANQAESLNEEREGAEEIETHLLEEFGQLDAADLVGETIGQAATPAANGASRPHALGPKIDCAARANDDNSSPSPLLCDTRAGAATRGEQLVDREPIAQLSTSERGANHQRMADHKSSKSNDIGGEGLVSASAPNADANANSNGNENENGAQRHVTPMLGGGGQLARERNLSQIIGDCIRGDQFKKLEHLILAGCGQRVQQIYATSLQEAEAGGGGGSSAGISPEMRAYLGGRAVEFMQTCEQIHKQVHQCQAHILFHSQLERSESESDDEGKNDNEAGEMCRQTTLTDALEHRLELNEETAKSLQDQPQEQRKLAAVTRETLNASFHKLSSLLQDNCFIMARDKFGASPLHVALLRSDSRLLDYLLRRHPSAASAPDHDNRTALHYAAIVLATLERHGPFKLTVGDASARAYWQVAGHALRQVYENLRLRFGHDLISLRDRKGKRAQDYLMIGGGGKQSTKDHLNLKKLPRGLYGAQLVGKCCFEYAEMLSRYNYKFLIARDLPEEQERELLRRATNQQGARATASEPITRIQSPSTAKVRPQHSCSFESRRQTRLVNTKNVPNYCDSTSSEPLALKLTTIDSNNAAVDDAELLAQLSELVPSRPAEVHQHHQVEPIKPLAPIKPLEIERPISREERRISKKQQQTHIKSLLHSSPRSTRKHADSKTANLSFTAPAELVPVPVGHSPLVCGSPPGMMTNAVMSSYSAPAIDNQPANRRRHKHKHKRGGSGKRNKTLPGRLSVVGGVIVPTIIHNDKMDEIETYDIIYRQPPPGPAQEISSTSSSSCNSSSTNLTQYSGSSNSSSRSSSLSNSATSLNSSLLSLDAENLDDQHHKHEHHHHHQHRHHHARNTSVKHLLQDKSNKLIKSPAGSVIASRSPLSPIMANNNAVKFGQLNGGLATRINDDNQDEDEEDDQEEEEEEEEDEEDDRVERLSNEFEDRVRREKSELRQKVDQIMKEIKLSAKSGKSSRFLASPNDLSALNNNNNNQGGPGSSQQTRIALTSDGMTANKFQVKIDGSKQSSATDQSTCSSNRSTCSASQCNSSHGSSSSLTAAGGGGGGATAHVRTSSCSSSSSAASNMSSISSPTTSLGGSRSRHLKPSLANKTVTINDPRAQQLASHHNQRPHHQVTIQAPIASAQGGSNRNHLSHLSELTNQMVSKNTYGQTYLHFIASKSQSSSTLYKVLDHGNHLIGERDIFYRTARDVALQFSLQNNVQVLDKYIIDLFIGGQTHLLWLLLNQGYSPLIHVSDPDGNDIMLILKLLKQERMIHHLLQMADFQRWRDELHTFIRHGYSAGVSELIRKHKDLVRAKSAYSRTSLHLAVLFDRADMLGELIAMDPQCVQAVDNMGRTPLHYVYGLHLKNGELIRDKLLEQGASLETRDVRERTPKYYYIFRREIEDIRRIELELN